MGACLFSEKTMDVLVPGTHGSTFGGNPIACAGGNVVFSKVTGEGFLDDVNAKAEYIRKRLELCTEVDSVSGLGLMIGIETEKDSSEVLKKCMERGILPIKAKTKIRLLPALNIPMDELKYAIEILKEVAGE
jgi:acetylornithine/N-succinyldiaminopimelate aminotransferase